MFKAHNTHFFWLWFPTVSICIYLGILLSQPLGKFLVNLNGLPYSVSDDGFLEDSFSLLFLVGLFMGFGQWIVINTKRKKSQGWILATLIGFSFGSLVSFWFFTFLSIIGDKLSQDYEWIWMIGAGAGAGMVTGFFQWVSLNEEKTDWLKWSLIMALSLAAGVASFFFVSSISREFGVIMCSIVVGLISGAFAEPVLIRSEVQNIDQQGIAI